VTEGRVSRRRFLGSAGALAASAAVAPALVATPADASVRAGGEPLATVAFHGTHQAGIVTPAQDRLLMAAFDVTSIDRADVVALLEEWTAAGRRMTQGEMVGRDNSDLDAPPDDTGEALGLSPARLTVTFGFGPTLFERDGTDRFGIHAQRPAALVDLPTFAGDVIDPARSNGDLVVQACADDPQVCFHAIRNLARIGRGTAALRWSQSGFGRTSSTSTSQATPRNLMGFKDGTNNLKLQDAKLVNEHVWVGTNDDPAWMRGGSYMVTRRIRMLLEVWDRSTLNDQEQTIGRLKPRGAPFGSAREFDPVDLDAKDRNGDPIVSSDAHVRLAAPSSNDGAVLLRRGYSFTDGIDPVTNQLDAGLFFVAYQRDPRTHFIPVQQNLAGDALNEYIRHTASGIYAIPPGVSARGWIGETLFS